MKRRRTLIVSLLLVTALCMGVGYAALSQDMIISGTANIKEEAMKVNFILASEATGTNSAGEDIALTWGAGARPANDNKVTTATFSIGDFISAGDEATFTLTIKNENLETVRLAAPDIKYHGNNAGDYIAVTATQQDDTTLENVEVAPNNELIVKVTVSLHTPFHSDSEPHTTTEEFTITIPAEKVIP